MNKRSLVKVLLGVPGIVGLRALTGRARATRLADEQERERIDAMYREHRAISEQLQAVDDSLGSDRATPTVGSLEVPQVVPRVGGTDAGEQIITTRTLDPTHRYHGSGRPIGGPRRPYGPRKTKPAEP